MKRSLDQQTIKFPKKIQKWWKELYLAKHPGKNKHPDTKKGKKDHKLPF